MRPHRWITYVQSCCSALICQLEHILKCTRIGVTSFAIAALNPGAYFARMLRDVGQSVIVTATRTFRQRPCSSTHDTKFAPQHFSFPWIVVHVERSSRGSLWMCTGIRNACPCPCDPATVNTTLFVVFPFGCCRLDSSPTTRNFSGTHARVGCTHANVS